MSAKATVCAKCGAPRDEHVNMALCRSCYNAHKAAGKSDPQGGERARFLRNTYSRLGLEPGKVWAKVLQ